MTSMTCSRVTSPADGPASSPAASRASLCLSDTSSGSRIFLNMVIPPTGGRTAARASLARVDDDVCDEGVPLVGQQIHVDEVRLAGVAVQHRAVDGHVV